MGKTPEYTKRAVNNYRQNYDFIQIRFDKKEKIREKLADKGNINDYICGLILADLGDCAEDQEENYKADQLKCQF